MKGFSGFCGDREQWKEIKETCLGGPKITLIRYFDSARDANGGFLWIYFEGKSMNIPDEGEMCGNGGWV